MEVLVAESGRMFGGGSTAGASAPPLSELASSSESLPPVSNETLCGGRASSQKRGFCTMNTL